MWDCAVHIGLPILSFAVQGICKIAMVSTYPPKNCGLATFTAALLTRLSSHTDLPPGCQIEVIAISDPSDRLVYDDPIVRYDLRVDSVRAPFSAAAGVLAPL